MTRMQAPAQPQWQHAPQAQAATRSATADSRPVAGGEAWIVAHEPGAPVWMSASAPQIAVTDQRVRATRAI
jgi:hypothetical protein